MQLSVVAQMHTPCFPSCPHPACGGCAVQRRAAEAVPGAGVGPVLQQQRYERCPSLAGLCDDMVDTAPLSPLSLSIRLLAPLHDYMMLHASLIEEAHCPWCRRPCFGRMSSQTSFSISHDSTEMQMYHVQFCCTRHEASHRIVQRRLPAGGRCIDVRIHADKPLNNHVVPCADGGVQRRPALQISRP